MDTAVSAEVERFILDSAVEANILPLTSRCDRRCVFCSHKNNPPGIVTFSVGVRSLRDITRTLAFLDPRRVITIGESATPIVEGEPFTHPELSEVLSLVRRVYPDTPVEITTNGTGLGPETVTLLQDMGNIALNVSLNSSSVRGRALLMGETPEESKRVFAAMDLLAASTVRFSGSLVAMPNLVGWEDVEGTVVFLAERGAEAVRVVMPAFSSRADPGIFPDPDRIYGELRGFVHGLSPDLPCPVLVEPSCPSDLTPVVSGVLKGSPAWTAGLRRDDVFVTINGLKPRCRVEAWNMLLRAGKIVAEVQRDGVWSTVEWTNRREGDSGVTMEYDFDPVRAERLRDTVLGSPGYSLLLTSELGYAVVCRVLELMELGKDRAEAVVVKNRTFGGTIGAAGLLTVDDFVAAHSAWRRRSACGASPTELIIPVESLDSRGFDLKRTHVSRLEQAAGVPVVPC